MNINKFKGLNIWTAVSVKSELEDGLTPEEALRNSKTSNRDYLELADLIDIDSGVCSIKDLRERGYVEILAGPAEDDLALFCCKVPGVLGLLTTSIYDADGICDADEED